MRDLASNLDLRRAISPAAAIADNSPVVSQILDRSGFESVVFIAITGQLADTDATFAVSLEHGDAADLSDAAAVPAIQLNGTLTDASFDFSKDDQVRKLGYVGGKRYLRAKITPAGNTGNAFVSGVWVLGAPNQLPTRAIPA